MKREGGKGGKGRDGERGQEERKNTLVGHGLPELLCNERHVGVRQLQYSIKGIHQNLHPSDNSLSAVVSNASLPDSLQEVLM